MENDKSDRKILKIFVIGSVLYVLLHYYLYMNGGSSSMIDKVKQYLYYVMGADFCIAYFLSSQKKSSDENNDETQGYSPEELQRINYQQMEQMRRRAMDENAWMNQQRMMAMQEQKNVFKKKEDECEMNGDEQQKIPLTQQQQAPPNIPEKQKNQKKEKSENEGTDVQLPIYNDN